MNSGLFKNVTYNLIHLLIINIYIYIYKKNDLALNNLQVLVCHKTQPNLFYGFCHLKNIQKVNGYEYI